MVGGIGIVVVEGGRALGERIYSLD